MYIHTYRNWDCGYIFMYIYHFINYVSNKDIRNYSYCNFYFVACDDYDDESSLVNKMF